MSRICFVVFPQKSEKWKTRQNLIIFILNNVYFYLWESSLEASCGGLRVSWLFGCQGNWLGGSRQGWFPGLTVCGTTHWHMVTTALASAFPLSPWCGLECAGAGVLPETPVMGHLLWTVGCWRLLPLLLRSWASVRKPSREVDPV